MNIEYTGRGTDFNPKLRRLVQDELGRINKMLGDSTSAHVILTEDKYRMSAEVNLLTAQETLTAKCEGTEMHQVLHDALRKLEQQVVKHKERKITVERHGKPDSAEPLIELQDVTSAT